MNNIKRHLEKEIDNVPLHVSLFTDSTKPAITSMIEIMKDYGEIVGCFGSTHSIENNGIFSVSNIGLLIKTSKLKLNSNFLIFYLNKGLVWSLCIQSYVSTMMIT